MFTQYSMHGTFTTSREIYILTTIFALGSILYFLASFTASHDRSIVQSSAAAASTSITTSSDFPIGGANTESAPYLEDQPPTTPYPDSFREVGVRTQILGNLLKDVDESFEAVDKFAASLFPFLAQQTESTNPTLSDLQSSVTAGSAGIVMVVGNDDLRNAAQLLSTIRHVLHSKLPVLVAYAGDQDLSPANRALLVELVGPTRPDLEFLDMSTVFDVADLKLWSSRSRKALKPFAVLSSTFEQVVLVDVDTLFFQKPEALFENTSYQHTGAFVFGDVAHMALNQTRLPQRHSRRNSTSIIQSTTQRGDAGGVVLLDKGQIDVLMGLLHVCWQNSRDNRENDGHQMPHVKDWPSWWLGLELAGALYGAEERNALGLVLESELGSVYAGYRISPCDFRVGHLDEDAMLIFCQGSLSIGLPGSEAAAEIEVGKEGAPQGCSVKEPIHSLTSMELAIVGDISIEAMRIDKMLRAQRS